MNFSMFIMIYTVRQQSVLDGSLSFLKHLIVNITLVDCYENLVLKFNERYHFPLSKHKPWYVHYFLKN